MGDKQLKSGERAGGIAAFQDRTGRPRRPPASTNEVEQALLVDLREDRLCGLQVELLGLDLGDDSGDVDVLQIALLLLELEAGRSRWVATWPAGSWPRT